MDETLLKVKSIHFKETVYIRATGNSNVMESHMLVLSWEDNLLFKQVDAVVNQNREIMVIKSTLDGAIQRKDELLLSTILGQLKVPTTCFSSLTYYATHSFYSFQGAERIWFD